MELCEGLKINLIGKCIIKISLEGVVVFTLFVSLNQQNLRLILTNIYGCLFLCPLAGVAFTPTHAHIHEKTHK